MRVTTLSGVEGRHLGILDNRKSGEGSKCSKKWLPGKGKEQAYSGLTISAPNTGKIPPLVTETLISRSRKARIRSTSFSE